MNNHIFKDIITQEEVKRSQNELYFPIEDAVKLKNKASSIHPELRDLISKAQLSLSSIKKCDDKSNLNLMKLEFDKIACMLNDIVEDFGPLYEEIVALHTAEKLAGTFDPEKEIDKGTKGTKGSKIPTILNTGQVTAKGYSKCNDDYFRDSF